MTTGTNSRSAARAGDTVAPAEARKRARSYLGQSVGDALAGTLGALTVRLTGRKAAAGGVGKRRLEEVLERDRAMREVEAQPSVTLSVPVVALAAEPASGPTKARLRRENDELAALEPIRTRTMARLLAAQGYTKRAAAIYAELSDEHPEDSELREALALLSVQG